MQRVFKELRVTVAEAKRRMCRIAGGRLERRGRVCRPHSVRMRILLFILKAAELLYFTLINPSPQPSHLFLLICPCSSPEPFSLTPPTQGGPYRPLSVSKGMQVRGVFSTGWARCLIHSHAHCPPCPPFSSLLHLVQGMPNGLAFWLLICPAEASKILSLRRWEGSTRKR